MHFWHLLGVSEELHRSVSSHSGVVPPGGSGQVIDVGHTLFVRSQLTSHWHELAHETSPHALSVPMHVAVHLPVPQVSAPHASVPPLHVSVQSPPVHDMVPHALLPAQVRVQSPVVHVSVPHTALPPPLMQLSVQFPVVQLTLPHALAPVHVTSQFFVAHETDAHALFAAQRTLQLAPAPQLIAPQAPALGHEMSQFQPIGQATLPLPVPVIVQVVVAKSQPPLQLVGHTAASSSRASMGSVPTMQYPD
jgi:hypothetical protein